MLNLYCNLIKIHKVFHISVILFPFSIHPNVPIVQHVIHSDSLSIYLFRGMAIPAHILCNKIYVYCARRRREFDFLGLHCPTGRQESAWTTRFFLWLTTNCTIYIRVGIDCWGYSTVQFKARTKIVLQPIIVTYICLHTTRFAGLQHNELHSHIVQPLSNSIGIVYYYIHIYIFCSIIQYFSDQKYVQWKMKIEKIFSYK